MQNNNNNARLKKYKNTKRCDTFQDKVRYHINDKNQPESWLCVMVREVNSNKLPMFSGILPIIREVLIQYKPDQFNLERKHRINLVITAKTTIEINEKVAYLRGSCGPNEAR